MQDTGFRAIAIVGVGAVLPDAPDVASFWNNITSGKYSIREVPRDRWDPALYYDADRNAPDKTYSKIGGWVQEFGWDPVKWRMAIPPRVVEAMDVAQRWAISCTRQALADYGYPDRPLDADRTAVILGNAMAGERHYLTAMRAHFPEYARELDRSATFAVLPAEVRREIRREWHSRVGDLLPPITEDSMPGELSNCLAGRIANLYNFRGPNFVCDAACASTMAAFHSAAEGLIENAFDVAITGGVDRNMGAPTFVKFCKIGALSATGSRPYAEGADGFVMGEGAAIFVIKRLADAERDGDRIYAVLRGIGGSSDGKGKGITAPNPTGQKICIERAWQNAGLSPTTATLMEGHGTSTSVGDVVEVESMASILKQHGVNGQKIALGSVKSNIGHLKGAAAAAGILKTALALHHKVIPPSVKCEHPNPNIDFAHSPLFVNTEVRPWSETADGVRRAGVSAFGFGGTNFHAVLEEYVPHRITANGKHMVAVEDVPGKAPLRGALVTGAASADQLTERLRGIQMDPEAGRTPVAVEDVSGKAPLRGALVTGAASAEQLAERLRGIQKDAEAGRIPASGRPLEADLRAAERIAIDYADAAELADKCAKAIKALATNQTPVWKALRAQGIFHGLGPAPKVAFLYPGQGSQYANMMRGLRTIEPIVARTFEEADRVMTPLLGRPLSDYIFVDPADPQAVAAAEENLRQTAITQPAVLATDLALTRLLEALGIRPDMTMGHSLGEYGALVAAGALPFADALEAVSARGREMARVSMADNGRMAAVFAPLADIERILQGIDGYVVIANLNSEKQAVIGGASTAVERAIAAIQEAGFNVVPLPVSHAFHTSIVAPASEPLRRTLEGLSLQPAKLPIVANVDGEFYPTGPDVRTAMLDILARQIASPVQFVKGLRTLYAAGARVFVEVGPKKALHGFVEDVLGEHSDVLALFTNHPKFDDAVAFNQALCGLYASGLGAGRVETESAIDSRPSEQPRHQQPVVITGASLGLPGTERIFDDGNLARILNGEQLIDVIPTRYRKAMLDKHITRLLKSDHGGPTFEEIRQPADVIKLAARGGAFDLETEFGLPADRVAALDRVTQLALAAGIDALRDAGIPLAMHYKNTSKGTRLPERWGLPDAMRDDTGVIFASVFPGFDSFAAEAERYYTDRANRALLATLEDLRARAGGEPQLLHEIDRRIAGLQAGIADAPYQFDRRFLFHVLSMGHSQFAEWIGARGPNTQINSACASTPEAVSLAEDWIRAGRCRRVIVISADDVTSDHLMEWFGAGFLASGAAATDDVVEDAAIPFDRRRHGMIMGMGAAALVVESADTAAERGLTPICEVLGAVSANSAFHGTRLDVDHIHSVMEELVRGVESRTGIRRERMAASMVFVSHETYTPARGGSASAEIHALRKVFGEAADRIVIANTKGLTGHAMGTGIEDVVAVKALETGCVPPVANFKEVDPELGHLNLSRGGSYPVEYALRLGAGFGSQISMTLLRRSGGGGAKPSPNALGYAYRVVDQAAWQGWLDRVAGHPAELEVVHRTLRVRNGEAAAPAIQQEKPVELVIPVETREAATPEAPVPRVASDPVRERILQLVVEKTGYPPEMLDLDLDLEADLGVDTVKQAEMFAAIRETYSIPRDPNLKLRDFPTLAHVIRFVYDRRPDLKADAPAKAVHPAMADDDIAGKVLAIVAEKTGYPIDMLDPDLDLEADLGIDTVKQAEMFASIRKTYHIPRDPNLKLRDFPTLGHVIRFAQDRRPDRKADAKPRPAPADDDIAGKVLAIVAEKTGYPIDMLDPDLDLEADLGIDTVKQAEMFASVRAMFDIPRDQNLKLRDFPTLGHVIRFAQDRRPDLKADAKPQPAPAGDDIAAKVLAIVAEKTGYPIDMLDPDLDLEADLGLDTVKQAEMFASVRAMFDIPRDQNLKLREFPTLGHVIRFARERRAAGIPAPAAVHVPTLALASDAPAGVSRRVPLAVLRPPLELCKPTAVSLATGRRVFVMPDRDGVSDALSQKLRARGVTIVDAESPADGVYWLPALDDEGELTEMSVDAWHEAVDARVKSFYRTMRSRYRQIEPAGTFLVSATRLGGRHGYDEDGASAPLGGAVTGFTKAYKRERPEVLVKAVDFEASRNADEIADLLIEETLRDPGALEIGYAGGQRWTVGLEEQSMPQEQTGMTLSRETVFVVTGAAGSIVSAITADLAAASGGTFHLLDLVPEPDRGNPELQRFATDRDGLKRDLFARIQARGERATPALVDRELASLERAQAARSAIQAVRASGGTAYYYAVDLTDADAVARVTEEVRRRSGRIDVLLHAAGIDRSHALSDKEAREFDLVFDVKSNGCFHLLRAIGDMPVGVLVGFSSIAGRFGNGGQTDYSAANDLLCKIASSFRRTRRATRALAIDWTAWGGIGMAMRGSIPKVMEMAGIDMLAPEAGVPWIRRELTAGSSGEVVVAGSLGALLKEWDATGGLALPAPLQGPMTCGEAKMDLAGRLIFTAMLDPAVQAFLRDHAIEGTPLLPGVMGIEAFAEAAQSIAPGWFLEAVEDVDFQAPFKFYRGEPRAVTVEAEFRPEGEGLVARCRLTGERLLPNQAQPRVATHFTGRVRLSRRPWQSKAGPPPVFNGALIEAADIYRVYFHGPAYRVVRRAWWSGNGAVGEMAAGLPDHHHPGDRSLAAAPRLIELCFQTAGLWEMAVHHRMGLPLHVDSVSLYRNPEEAAGPLFAIVAPRPAQECCDVEVVDAAGTRYLQVSGYRTVTFREDVDAGLFAAAESLTV